MLYAILFLLLFGLTLSFIGLYLVRRDWNDPEIRELSILWVYVSFALIEAATFLLFLVVISPRLAGFGITGVNPMVTTPEVISYAPVTPIAVQAYTTGAPAIQVSEAVAPLRRV